MYDKYAAAAEEYITRLKFRNLSERTLTNYERVLRLFGAFLAEQSEDDAGDLYDAVELWKETLLRNGNKESTVCQYLTTLKIFFDKATKRSFPKALRFKENPVDMDEAPKVITRPYDELLTDEQVISLFRNEPPATAKNSLWARNYAILMILLNMKIRNAELLDLKLSDIDFMHHELVVANGKGRKTRTLDMDALTESAILLYLDSGTRPAYLSDDDYLFGTTAPNEKCGGARTGAKWHRGSGRWLSEVVRRMVLAVTGVDDIRTHDCRHIGSRICLNAGASAEQLQGELGHASVALVDRYAGRLLQRRRRESAQAVLAARDEAARKNMEIVRQHRLAAQSAHKKEA